MPAVRALGAPNACGPRRSASCRVDVVEGDVERANPEVVHLLQLGHERLVVGVARVADGVSGREREREPHVVLGRRRHEVAELCELVGRVRVAPAIAVIGVVLRRVDVRVGLDVTVELDLVEPLVVRPGLTVEALDRAAQRHRREVADRRAGDAVAAVVVRHEQLVEGLDGVELSGRVDTAECDGAEPACGRVGPDRVALGVGRHLRRTERRIDVVPRSRTQLDRERGGARCARTLVDSIDTVRAQGRAQLGQRSRIGAVVDDDLDALGHVDVGARAGHRLRRRTHRRQRARRRGGSRWERREYPGKGDGGDSHRRECSAN